MAARAASASVLACHDILATIFDLLAPGGSDFNSSCRTFRKALASSALACRVLSDHALDVLWRELDDVQPLLKLLPNYKRVDSHFMLCGAISLEHWTRLRHYADRVRVIAHPPQRKDRIHPSVWPFLAQKSGGEPLLPRLRELIVCDLFVSMTSALTLLVSPTLRIIDLSTEACTEAENEDLFNTEVDPPMASLLLQTLPFMAADLEDFYFDAEVTFAPGDFQLFSCFTKLRVVTIGRDAVLDEHALQALSTMSTLQKLWCSIDLSGSSTSLSTLPSCAFRKLTEMSVDGNLDHLVRLILACQLSPLASLDLQITHPLSFRQPAESFAAICQHCDSTLLTSFSVTFKAVAPPPHTNRLLEYFEPLLALRNLSSFRAVFAKCTTLRVHDDDLARFGEAWPLLAKFLIVYDVSYSDLGQDTQGAGGDTANPTLAGVVELARRCPGLAAFQVPELDARAVPEKDAVPLLGHGLRLLSFRHVVQPCSPCNYVEAAAVLDRVFPAIDLEEALRLTWYSGKGWKEILHSLKALRQGREIGELYAELPPTSATQ